MSQFPKIYIDIVIDVNDTNTDGRRYIEIEMTLIYM